MSERGYGGPFLALREAALTMTLPEFLLARIAEDEADARVELERFIRDHGPAELVDTTWAHPYMDPRRVLAGCERDRRIITEHEPVDYSDLGMKSPNACSLCGADLGMSDWEWERDSFPCATLRALALPYADHPDYQEAWKP